MKQPTRRQFVKGAGGIGALAVGGVGASHFASQDGAAQVDADHNVGTTRLTGSGMDGKVEEITLHSQGAVSWENVTPAAKAVNVSISVEHPNDSNKSPTLVSKEFTDVPNVATTDEPFSYGILRGNVFNQSPWTSKHFEAPGEGETATTEFVATLHASVLRDADEETGPSAWAETDVVVEVTNEETQMSGGLEQEFDGNVEVL